ncbi:uncharacterized protein LOC132270653 [Cornus florida]|uniref:uncharacterized protein LOC132270653 n=1 Tax=Cornus florida TaxID=4283 RepID=UPI0028A19BD6|nr:uncharacterized protein LOC132270653 [Cornus florida]
MADRESRDAIVIFSNNYASYSSCADELAEIKEEDNKLSGHTDSPILDLSQLRRLSWSCFKDIEENGSANFNASTIKISSPSCALPEAYNLSSISIGSLHFNQQKNTASLRQISNGLLTSEFDPNISNLVYENDMKSLCFINPDKQRVLPNCGDIDVEIEKVLRQAGALRARDLSNHDSDPDAVCHCREGYPKPSDNPIKDIVKPRKEFLCSVLLLLMATLVAKLTYQAAFSLPGGTLKGGYTYNYAANGSLQPKKRDLIVTSSFILFNSIGFVASVAVIIVLLHEFPMKPWPQICVCTLFGSYVCLIMATSPREALALLFLAIPFLLLASAAKLHGFCKSKVLLKFSYMV